MTHLDTHVVVWLYAGRKDLLSTRAVEALEGDATEISPIVLLELESLRETGRTTESATTVLGDLQQRIGLRVCEAPFASVVSCAVRHDWTQDPFDRLIVGQAEAAGATLLTRDREILEKFEHAVW